ncbi:hypothetical protein [Oleiharenicola lentus]|uniref:hypothetical protein n=1 Tax=Oleiharenicola lentus TaxID=2508720 RepID=UPI0013E92BE8|nr:hypothetical protein [Oleiharenicola lentus]
MKLSKLAVCSFLAGSMLNQPGCTSVLVGASLRWQENQNRAARPHFDAIITSKVKIGDTLSHALQVLTDAGLTYSIDRFDHTLVSLLRTGKGCGIQFRAKLDDGDRITDIKVQELLTGL